eukprot:6173120-Pyramimonas_sp.AAC.1
MICPRGWQGPSELSMRDSRSTHYEPRHLSGDYDGQNPHLDIIAMTGAESLCDQSGTVRHDREARYR